MSERQGSRGRMQTHDRDRTQRLGILMRYEDGGRNQMIGSEREVAGERRQEKMMNPSRTC